MTPTFAVLLVEEGHVKDGGLVLHSFQHIAVLWPVSLLQDRIIYLWEAFIHLGCIVSGQGQGLGEKVIKISMILILI